MIQLLIVDSKQDERLQLEKCAHIQVLNNTDDRCIYNVFSGYVEASKFVEQADSLDIAMLEMSANNSKDFAVMLRKKFRDIMLVLVAEGSDPSSYIVPEIFMNALVIRSSDPEKINSTIKKSFEWFCQNNYKSSNSCYSFKGKDGRMMIDYSNIAFFESREKRIVLSTDNEEYYFYDTIDNLVKVLPSEFVRCHRSFIVNVDRIQKVRLSDNCLFLDNGFIVPLSRSYKSEIKGRINF